MPDLHLLSALRHGKRPFLTTSQPRAEARHQSPLQLLALGALGVVYGDIGTSPLYALRECFLGARTPSPSTRANVLGVLSLVFWSLMLVVSRQVPRLRHARRQPGRGRHPGAAGAGARRAGARRKRRHGRSSCLGLFGAALLYGDGMITPAISVLSAVEGLEVATPRLRAATSCRSPSVILVGLFLVQRHGTGRVGMRLRARSCSLWFAVARRARPRRHRPRPRRARGAQPAPRRRVLRRPTAGTASSSLGSVFLVVTGGEALYADMGHFGERPIRVGWYALVLPGARCSTTSARGRCSSASPAAVENPFYQLAPAWALYPLVVARDAGDGRSPRRRSSPAPSR